MTTPKLPAGWTYERIDLDGQPHTHARNAAGRATFWMLGRDEGAHVAAAAAAANLAAAIRDGLLSARPPASADQPRQANMFQDLRGAQLAEDRRTLRKKHGSFYQPHCWHCTRRRPDRPRRRARQS
jgi:hypothetical protein